MRMIFSIDAITEKETMMKKTGLNLAESLVRGATGVILTAALDWLDVRALPRPWVDQALSQLARPEAQTRLGPAVSLRMQ